MQAAVRRQVHLRLLQAMGHCTSSSMVQSFSSTAASENPNTGTRRPCRSMFTFPLSSGRNGRSAELVIDSQARKRKRKYIDKLLEPSDQAVRGLEQQMTRSEFAACMDSVSHCVAHRWTVLVEPTPAGAAVAVLAADWGKERGIETICMMPSPTLFPTLCNLLESIGSRVVAFPQSQGADTDDSVARAAVWEGAGSVLLPTTAEGAASAFLTRLGRGNHLKSLALPLSTKKSCGAFVLRPLMHKSESQLEALARRAGIAPPVWESVAPMTYGRFVLDQLPGTGQSGQYVDNSMVSLLKYLQTASDGMDSQAVRLLHSNAGAHWVLGGVSFDQQKFFSAHSTIQEHALSLAATSLGGNPSAVRKVFSRQGCSQEPVNAGGMRISICSEMGALVVAPGKWSCGDLRRGAIQAGPVWRLVIDTEAELGMDRVVPLTKAYWKRLQLYPSSDIKKLRISLPNLLRRCLPCVVGKNEEVWLPAIQANSPWGGSGRLIRRTQPSNALMDALDQA